MRARLGFQYHGITVVPFLVRLYAQRQWYGRGHCLLRAFHASVVLSLHNGGSAGGTMRSSIGIIRLFPRIAFKNGQTLVADVGLLDELLGIKTPGPKVHFIQSGQAEAVSQ